MKWTWPEIWNGERGGWWRVLLTLSLTVAGLVAGMMLHTLISVGGLREALQSQPVYLQDLAALGATVMVTGLGLAGCLIGVRWVHRRPLRSVFTDGRAFGWPLALQSAVVWGLLWCGFTLSLPGVWSQVKGHLNEFSLVAALCTMAAAAIAMTVGRTMEEVVFRGYFLTRISAWFKHPWVAIGFVALVFSLLHNGNPAARTAIVLFGIAWGIGCVRAGTLAPMIGAHVVHDTLNILLLPREYLKGNASTTWLEVGLIAVAQALWLTWLFWATHQSAPATLRADKPAPAPAAT